ncbi:hypothetical protein [uncultured Azohydromonas sp.]|jgi:hypothetical protein|uniref:hypothetical protein n=1 Tax=uncultured Azohydromonas sp. TaxID=487342 RepID=UPI0026172281|nr:hypothetical protein [uncultured Azohydromonas sp.]
MSTTTTMKSSAELAAWLLLDACESATIERGNKAMFFGPNEGEAGLLDGAYEALTDGDHGRAVGLLREAVRLAGEPVPEVKEGRNRAECQRRAQRQCERLLNVAQIAMALLEQPAAVPVALSPAPTINLMAAADAAESFARALRVVVGQEGGAA